MILSYYHPDISSRIHFIIQTYVSFQAEVLYRFRAVAGLDYHPVSSSHITLNDGESTGNLPITVIADDIPELQEKFILKLLKVELIGTPPNNDENLPKLGKSGI